MTLYVDSSALLKRYVREHDSDLSVQLMETDPVLVTSRLSTVEVRRNLSRLLDDHARGEARGRFVRDLGAFGLISVDDAILAAAAAIAEDTLCRSLDSIHLASARRTGSNTTLLTFDIRQAQVARSLGMHVVGT